MLSFPNLVKISPLRYIFKKTKNFDQKNFFGPFLAHFLKIDPFFLKMHKKRKTHLLPGKWSEFDKNLQKPLLEHVSQKYDLKF